MYRPSKYNLSQASLEFFANKFNSLPGFQNIKWIVITEETFDNDGYFIDLKTGKTIGFDWEIRDKYFSEGKFDYKTLGQYERKTKKPTIELSIQCDKECCAIIVAWHEDFKAEQIEKIQLATDTNVKEDGQTRYTEHFEIYKYSELIEFKKMINDAFKQNLRNHNLFGVRCSECSSFISPGVYSYSMDKYKKPLCRTCQDGFK